VLQELTSGFEANAFVGAGDEGVFHGMVFWLCLLNSTKVPQRLTKP
jgi:hypothetical protein